MTATINVKKNRPNYYVVVRYHDETDGKEHQKWIATDIAVKGNNKRKAERRKNEVLAQYRENENALCNRTKIDSGKDVYFTGFIKEWLETSRKTKKITESTYDGYLLNLNVHIVPYFEPMKLKVKDIEPMHIQKYVNSKLENLSPNTVKKHVSNISKCLDTAVRQNILKFNPVQRIEEIKKVKYTGAKFLNEREIEKLLACSKGDPLEIVIFLTLFYGLRRSEVLGLKWSAIDFENRVISINHTVVRTNKAIHCKDSTKNDSSNAMLPLPDILKCHLKKWRAKQAQNKLLQPNDYIDSDYVCTMYNGDLMKPDYVSRHFKLLLSKNDLKPIRFHDIRHSSASYLKHLGFDLKDIQVWLRHADIQTSMNLYTHLDMDAKRNIADKLDTRITALGF